MHTSFDDSDAATAYRSKEKCLSQYDQYYDWTRSFAEKYIANVDPSEVWTWARAKMKTTILPLPQVDEKFTFYQEESGNYSVREQLDKKLTNRINRLPSMDARKQEVRNRIVDYVADKGYITYSAFLKARFGDATEEEIFIAYKYLIKKKVLIEKPAGSGMRITLPPTSCATENPYARSNDIKGNNTVCETGASNNSVNDFSWKLDMHAGSETHRDAVPADLSLDNFVSMLQECGIRYIDKTANDGCLWVECTEQTDNLSALRVDGIHPVKASKTRHFDGDPGWYIRPNK